jgi:thioredoxin reductase (NADPH)
LESEQKYSGFGVSACAVCDGFFFKGQDVAIVGAGDTAAEEATYLAKLCRKVYMMVRRDEFRASKAMVHRVLNTQISRYFTIPKPKRLLAMAKA